MKNEFYIITNKFSKYKSMLIIGSKTNYTKKECIERIGKMIVYKNELYIINEVL